MVPSLFSSCVYQPFSDVYSRSASSARQLLPGIDHLAGRVLAGDHVVNLEPRIEDRDRGRIRSRADVNSAIDDGAEGRTSVLRRAAQIQPAVHGDARADGLQAIQRRPVDLGDVPNRPVQIFDRRHGVDLLERLRGELVLIQGQRVLLERPAVLGDQLQRGFVVRGPALGGDAPRRGKLADSRKLFSMSSPKSGKMFSRRCFSIGTSGRVSCDRKKMRRRCVILPSRCSAMKASYMVHGFRLSTLSATEASCMSGVPGSVNAPISTLVVRPKLVRYVIASTVPRFMSSKVWMARSAFSAALNPGPAMTPASGSP